MIAVPLRHREEAVGLLTVLSRTPNAFTTEDLNTLELLAVVLASVMSHASEFEALARFRTIFQASSVGIVRVDRDGRVVEANPAMEKMLGYTASELAAISFREYTHPDDVDRNVHLFSELMAGRLDSVQLEMRYFRRDGEMIWTQMTAAIERDADGEPACAISMVENITERKAAEEALRRQSELNEYQALHDGLTGLPNRTLFHDRIEQAILTAGARGRPRRGADDGPRPVQGDQRHARASRRRRAPAGDRAAAAERRCATADTVARLGGDEFGLLLPQHCEPAGRRASSLERICEGVEEPIMLEGMPLDDRGAHRRRVLARARPRRRNAAAARRHRDVPREGRRTRLRVLRRGAATPTTRRVSRSSASCAARSTQDELVLDYQPKVGLADGRVDSLEALVRWHHPGAACVPPDEFIPLAEQTGLIKPLTRYVLAAALEQCRALARREGSSCSIAVNLSTRDAARPRLPDDVGELLESTGCRRRVLELEITESAMIADPRAHARPCSTSSARSASGSRSTTSAPATRRSRTSSASRSTRSRSTGRSSCTWTRRRRRHIVRSTIELGRSLGLDGRRRGGRERADLAAAAGARVHDRPGLLPHPARARSRAPRVAATLRPRRDPHTGARRSGLTLTPGPLHILCGWARRRCG